MNLQVFLPHPMGKGPVFTLKSEFLTVKTAASTA